MNNGWIVFLALLGSGLAGAFIVLALTHTPTHDDKSKPPPDGGMPEPQASVIEVDFKKRKAA